MANQLLLLSTEGCHLCEEASLLCQRLGVTPQEIDIVEQEQWYESYRDKIPVLVLDTGEAGLFWPFSEHELIEFIEFYGINKNN